MFILVAPQNAVGNCIIEVSILEIATSCCLKKFTRHTLAASFIFLTLRLNLQDLKAMTVAAGSRPVILINPKLKVGIVN
jgi:hypothetical protein